MWDLEVSIFRDFPVDFSSSNLIPGQESLFKHHSLKKKKLPAMIVSQLNNF